MIYDFGKCAPIFEIHSREDSWEKMLSAAIKTLHLTWSALMLYLVKV